MEHIYSRYYSASENDKLLVIGCGGHSKVVSQIAACLGFVMISYVDTYNNISQFNGFPVSNEFPRAYDGLYFVAIGNNKAREDVTAIFQRYNPESKPISLIDPSASVASDAIIGKGAVVMPLSAINSSASIGDGVIINTMASVDHDCVLQSFSSLAPGVNMGGNVVVGLRSAICIGAAVRNRIAIGSDVVVGAGSVVITDIADNSLSFGSPCRRIRYRHPEEAYL